MKPSTGNAISEFEDIHKNIEMRFNKIYEKFKAAYAIEDEFFKKLRRFN